MIWLVMTNATATTIATCLSLLNHKMCQKLLKWNQIVKKMFFVCAVFDSQKSTLLRSDCKSWGLDVLYRHCNLLYSMPEKIIQWIRISISKFYIAYWNILFLCICSFLICDLFCTFPLPFKFATQACSWQVAAQLLSVSCSSSAEETRYTSQ